MKPSVAKRNMPAARKLRPRLEPLPIVATSTIEPRLPSIGMAFISTPEAPSPSCSSGGGCSTIWPPGISGSSSRWPPRSVVLNASPSAVPDEVATMIGGLPREPHLRLLSSEVVLVPGQREGGPVSDVAMSSSARATSALSIHGPAGVLDLVVPAGATAVDVAREYAQQADVPGIPLLQTALGERLNAAVPLGEAGIQPGDVLVATTSVHRPRRVTLLQAARNAPESP